MTQRKERTVPAPNVSVEGREFWSAAAQGQLMLKGCEGCGRLHWYPRAICPFCFGDAALWRAACGRGTIYSYSIMRQAPVPYAIAYVTLEEGPTLLSNITGTAFDDIAIGKAVKLVFAPTEGGPPVPVFEVVDASATYQ